MQSTFKSIRVCEETHNRLRQLAHLGQSFDGVIQELLELAEKVEKAQTPIVDYASKEGRQ